MSSVQLGCFQVVFEGAGSAYGLGFVRRDGQTGSVEPVQQSCLGLRHSVTLQRLRARIVIVMFRTGSQRNDVERGPESESRIFSSLSFIPRCADYRVVEGPPEGSEEIVWRVSAQPQNNEHPDVGMYLVLIELDI